MTTQRTVGRVMTRAQRASRVIAVVALFAALCAGPWLAGAQGVGSPDLILFGGKIFTADSTNAWVEAIAIRGDRITATGTNELMRALAGPATRMIDVGGRVVVPGFNDAHDHVGAARFAMMFTTVESLTPDPTLGQVLDSLRIAAARAPKDTWLRTDIGMRFLDDPTARRRMLDAAAPRNPVLLWMWTGHDVVLNTAALRALGIADDARNPVGGEYERDDTGRLTGRVSEYAAWASLQRLYSLVPDSMIVSSLRRYAADGLRFGITSVQDMNGYLDPATTVRVMRAARLPIRFRVVPLPMTDVNGRRTTAWATVDRHPSPLTVVSGSKWILDGTPVERLAFMRAPYVDRSGWRGQLDLPEDTIRVILAEALVSRQPLMLHAVGDSTVRLVLNLMQQLAPDSVWRALRVRIEHGDGMGAELLPVARRLGVVVVQNPSHFTLGQELIRQRFGSVPADFQPMRSLLMAGVPLALGSDGPRNPFINMMLASTHPMNPAEALTREQAVTAYTRGSAWAEFAEGEKGMLVPGMLADVAVLSKDIFMIPAQELPGTVSVLTLVGGETAYDAGILRTMGRSQPKK